MKEHNIPSALTEAEKRIDQAIADNQEIFQKNLNAMQKLFTQKPQTGKRRGVRGFFLRKLEHALQRLYGPAADRQEQLYAYCMHMLQDLNRLSDFLAERAYVKGQIDRLKIEQDFGDSQLVRIDRLHEVMRHPLFRLDRKQICIIQIVSFLYYGDAVGNDVLAIGHALEEEGIATAIFTKDAHAAMRERGVFPIAYLPELKKDDIVIYHFASQDAFVDKIKRLGCQVVLRYHNVTPPIYFHGFDPQAEQIAAHALEQVKNLKETVGYVMGDSQFNCENLKRMGYRCPMETVPVLIPFAEYAKEPDDGIVKRYRDGRTNLIFVGRCAPNKKIEDVIQCFAAYQRTYDPQARLFLAGSYQKEGAYYAYLKKIIQKEGVSDVIFTGHISFAKLLAYYRVSDVFLCMSEHEGFCVPLAEAMYLNVPVIAFRSSAVTQTLGDAGVLTDAKEPGAVAVQIHKIVTEPEYEQRLVRLGQERIRELAYDKVKSQMMCFLSRIGMSRKEGCVCGNSADDVSKCEETCSDRL